MIPRTWQVEATSRWEREGGRGVVSVVTGGGKTFLSFYVFERLRQNAPDAQMVVLVPSLALLDQWAVAAKEALALDDREVALFSGESFARSRGRVNIAVLNTARAKSLPSGSKDTLLVVDEVHRAGSIVNAQSLAISSRYTLGLSATPEREFDDGFERFIEPRLGPILYEYDYRQARLDGVIVDFTLHNYRVQDDAKRSRAQSQFRIVGGSLVALGFPGRRLIFSERIDSAERVAALIRSRGGRAATYHSHMSPALRRRNLELFRTGQFDSLVTCRALDEGVDVPIANVAVISAGTRSVRQRIQRVGRVLRLAPGKHRADVATLYSSDTEEEALRDESADLDQIAETRWYELAK